MGEGKATVAALCAGLDAVIDAAVGLEDQLGSLAVVPGEIGRMRRQLERLERLAGEQAAATLAIAARIGDGGGAAAVDPVEPIPDGLPGSEGLDPVARAPQPAGSLSPGTIFALIQVLPQLVAILQPIFRR